MSGLQAPVEIYRTRHAIPHVIGQSDPDTFLGLGYAHAQDRFWQMEMLRRTAKGRLSELVGPQTVGTDELMLRLGLYEAADSSLEAQSPYAKSVLTSYAAGVNARLAEVAGSGALAPEFLLFPAEIEPWDPADSLAILKLIALQLASQIDKEVTRARVAQLVPQNRLGDILPDAPAMPRFDVTYQETGLLLLPKVDAQKTKQASLVPEPDWHVGWSSNAWLAGPARSTSGASILANDPHLNFGAPSIWYLARIELEDGYVIGGTIPSIPMVLSGRSEMLAWGLTAANMDDQDVYFERVNPDNPGEVLTPSLCREHADAPVWHSRRGCGHRTSARLGRGRLHDRNGADCRRRVAGRFFAPNLSAAFAPAYGVTILAETAFCLRLLLQRATT